MTYKVLHQDFVLNSRSRWRELVHGLPEDDPARLKKGFGEIAVSVLGLTQPISDESLENALSNRPRGWHTFSGDDWYYTTEERNQLERWRGDPVRFNLLRAFALYDYGRILYSGNVYRRIGFDERWHRRDPGTVFDLTLPICDVGCMLLYAADMADWCGDNLDVAVSFTYSGLSGRRLDMSRGWLEHTAEYISELDVYCSQVQCYSVRQIRLDLRRILLGLLTPLYQEFAGFVLRPGLIDHYVHQEILGHYPLGR
ncbi:MAG: hypothetical protein OXI77_08320 [Chloroflexota bacterium]|nr:hypothetical protein [Chloroflexota bacterium]MDE2910682.1 hypothetical protein [Chloroflexota bacterium]